MITLGIETSCDETAVAVVRGNKVLAEALASSVERHAPYGGVVPEIASRAHTEALLPLIDSTLRKAKVPLKKIDLVAVTGGPGLMGAVLVGVAAAKSIAVALDKPIAFVDHVLAHAYAGVWTLPPAKKYPFVALVVSGGHTILLHWKSAGDIELIGKTMDDAAGEAFDKVGKLLGLGYPGGPVIDRLARQPGIDPKVFQFPRSQMNEAHFDFSFSGLKTSVFYRVSALEKEGPLTPAVQAQVAAGFQEAACEVLTAKAIRACRERQVKRLVVGGGVSANSRLQTLLTAAAQKEGPHDKGPSKKGPRKAGLEVVFPGAQLSVDNAVMIAALGQEMARVRSKRLGVPGKGSEALDFEPYSDFFGRKFFYTHSRKGRIE